MSSGGSQRAAGGTLTPAATSVVLVLPRLPWDAISSGSEVWPTPKSLLINVNDSPKEEFSFFPNALFTLFDVEIEHETT